MLQDISSNLPELGEAKTKAAKKVLLNVVELQEKLLGKGLFRRFLEDRMATESEAEMACSSPAFAAAASLLIRSSLTVAVHDGNITNTSDEYCDSRVSVHSCSLACAAFLPGSNKTRPFSACNYQSLLMPSCICQVFESCFVTQAGDNCYHRQADE